MQGMKTEEKPSTGSENNAQPEGMKEKEGGGSSGYY